MCQQSGCQWWAHSTSKICERDLWCGLLFPRLKDDEINHSKVLMGVLICQMEINTSSFYYIILCQSPVADEGRVWVWVDTRVVMEDSDTGHFWALFYKRWTERKHIPGRDTGTPEDDAKSRWGTEWTRLWWSGELAARLLLYLYRV